ncbi:hypothetical protein TWF594_006630 [Orbilia oligospora]|nr:hypothetical protein TWF594_006630 [Orbilia oligospora]
MDIRMRLKLETQGMWCPDSIFSARKVTVSPRYKGSASSFSRLRDRSAVAPARGPGLFLSVDKFKV